MTSQYAICEATVEKFKKMVDDGFGFNQACRSLNVPTSTMRGTLTRMGLSFQNMKDNSLSKKSSSKVDSQLEDATISYAIIKDSDVYTVIVDGEYYNINSTNPLSHSLHNREKYYLTDAELSSIKEDSLPKAVKNVVKKIKHHFNIDMVNGTIDGVGVSKELINVVDKVINSNDTKSHYIKFTKKLIKNENSDIPKQLFEFMLHHDFKISVDGNIIAYKGIGKDYKDIYTGTIDNSIGNTVKMPRSEVDSNPSKFCSYGLHVGSKEYATTYAKRNDGILVECHINPKNVVSVPTDYNGQKCRVCKYNVVKELIIE